MIVAGTSGITRTSRSGMPRSPRPFAMNRMLASWVRPDSTSLPMTSRQAMGFLSGIGASLEEIAQQRDQRLVGRRHRVIGKLLRPHPGKRLVLARLRHALPTAAQIQRHQQMDALVFVRRKGERREACGGN